MPFSGEVQMQGITQNFTLLSPQQILEKGGRYLCSWAPFEHLFWMLQVQEVIIGLYFCHLTRQNSLQILATEEDQCVWEEATSSGAWVERGFFALPVGEARNLFPKQ